MRHKLQLFICTALIAAQFSIASAWASPNMVINADTGDVLYAEESLRAWYPASLTKLMTAYIVFQALSDGKVKPTTFLKVSANAHAQKPSKLGLKTGSSITVEAALNALLTKSANDIAYVLAEGIGGSTPAFVAKMNREALRLGLTGTNFVNPNGLPNPQQVTTARDMAILAHTILTEFPQYEGFFRVPGLKIGNKIIRTYNALIGRYAGASGMKTGFVCSSGFNLVASAARGGRRYIVVVLGETSSAKRAERAAELLDSAFDGSIRGSGYTALSLRNMGDTPPDMHDTMCGKNRIQQAAENEETPEAITLASADRPEGQGFGQPSVIDLPRSRLTPKPIAISPLTITIEKLSKKGPEIAYIDHGGRPPLDEPKPVMPTTITPDTPKKKTTEPQKTVKFLPAHPTEKGRITASKPVKIPATHMLPLRPTQAADAPISLDR